MIPKISRGDRSAGLMTYLAGPGKANEHADVHIVAASPLLVSHPVGVAMSEVDARQVARELDVPKNAFDVTVPKGHVFHCSLSLRADEGIQTDERWAEIADEFVEKMGFTEGSGKAPCRWVAVRHGLSKAGNDHIHIAVSVVREDGTKWSDYNDRPRAQKAARDLEEKFGLFRVGGLNAERGYDRAERQIAEEKGLPELQRDTLQRSVRAAAAASIDEAEFVRRLRGTGVLVRPRFAHGRTDVVEGFSVAIRPATRAERPIWFGGGRLARDLTLPKLRADWPDTVEGAQAASAEWIAASSNKRVVAPGREAVTPTTEQWAKYAAEMAGVNERIKATPITDTVAWAQVARATSGVLAGWSVRTEATPGPLAEASRALSRSAQLAQFPPAVKHGPLPSAKGAGMLLMQSAVGPSTAAGTALLMRQMMTTVSAVSGMQREAGYLREAERLRGVHEGALARVHERYLPTAQIPVTGRWARAVPVAESPASVAVATSPEHAPMTREQRELAQLQRLRAAASGAPVGVNRTKPPQSPTNAPAAAPGTPEQKKGPHL